MKFKSTYIMAAFMLALGIYVFYIDIPQTEKTIKEKELAEKIIPFEKEDVEEFTISHSGISITMEKQKEGWGMVSPAKAKGDKKNSDAIISRLNSVTYSRVVDKAPGTLETYGLTKPKLIIYLKLKGQEKKKIIVGNTTPLGNGVYIKRDWDKIIYLSGTYIRDDLIKNVYDLRDKKAVNINKEKVKVLHIKSKNNLIVLTKIKDKWNISKPIEAEGDNDEIESIINKIKNLEVKNFIEENSNNLKKYGLDSPDFSIKILQEDPEKSTELLIGKKFKDDYYIKTKTLNSVALLKGEDVKKIISANHNTLREKKILKFNKDQVEKIELIYPDEYIAINKDNLSKEKDMWNISQPIITKGNEVEIARLLTNLEKLEVNKFLPVESKKENKTNFDILNMEVRLWGKDKKNIFSLEIGKTNQMLGGHISRLTNKDIIFILSELSVENISKKPYSLRDRRLISFDEEKVNKIEIKYSNKNFLVQKDGKNWMVINPEKKKASEVKVRVFLWTIRDIEFSKIVSPGKNNNNFGLKNPPLIISVWQKKEKTPKKLFIGNNSSDKNFVYAHENNTNQIYLIKEEIVKKIPWEIDDFLE